MNARLSPLALVASKPIPANLKANVDLLALIKTAIGNARQSHVPRGGRLDYWDDGEEPDMGPITDEVERLQGAEYDRDELLEASTGVLLVLSRLQGVIAALEPEAGEAVAKFASAVKEASNG